MLVVLSGQACAPRAKAQGAKSDEAGAGGYFVAAGVRVMAGPRWSAANALVMTPSMTSRVRYGLYTGVGGGLYSGPGGGLYSGPGGGLYTGACSNPYRSNWPPLPYLVAYLEQVGMGDMARLLRSAFREALRYSAMAGIRP
jgi:hypothetical protein